MMDPSSPHLPSSDLFQPVLIVSTYSNVKLFECLLLLSYTLGRCEKIFQVLSVCWSGIHGLIAYSLLGGGVPVPEQPLCGTLDSVSLKFKFYYVLYPSYIPARRS